MRARHRSRQAVPSVEPSTARFGTGAFAVEGRAEPQVQKERDSAVGPAESQLGRMGELGLDFTRVKVWPGSTIGSEVIQPRLRGSTLRLPSEMDFGSAGPTAVDPQMAGIQPLGGGQGLPDGLRNRTGMPDRLKSGLEHMSGLALSDVRVHYNSPKPAKVQALAYTQGQDIHVARGQEKHLPHEGWHAIQQMQGRVKPTMKAHGVAINDDSGLETEADVMGNKALQMRSAGASIRRRKPLLSRHRWSCNTSASDCGRHRDQVPAVPIQPEPTATPAGDRFEQETGRVAAQVVRRIHAPARYSRPAMKAKADRMASFPDHTYRIPQAATRMSEGMDGAARHTSLSAAVIQRVEVSLPSKKQIDTTKDVDRQQLSELSGEDLEAFVKDQDLNVASILGTDANAFSWIQAAQAEQSQRKETAAKYDRDLYGKRAIEAIAKHGEQPINFSTVSWAKQAGGKRPVWKTKLAEFTDPKDDPWASGTASEFDLPASDMKLEDRLVRAAKLTRGFHDTPVTYAEGVRTSGLDPSQFGKNTGSGVSSHLAYYLTKDEMSRERYRDMFGDKRFRLNLTKKHIENLRYDPDSLKLYNDPRLAFRGNLALGPEYLSEPDKIDERKGFKLLDNLFEVADVGADEKEQACGILEQMNNNDQNLIDHNIMAWIKVMKTVVHSPL